MGIMDRDWYRERWEKRVLGWSPARRRRVAKGSVPVWPFVVLAACLVAAWVFAKVMRALF